MGLSLSPNDSSHSIPADHAQYSITISTSSRPLSGFSGSFHLTIYPYDGDPVVYDFPHGRFPRASTVRFSIAIPAKLSVAGFSIQARYRLGLAKWRLRSLHLLPIDPQTQFVCGEYTVPAYGDEPSIVPLNPLLSQSDLAAGGSAILHIWLPSWNRALRDISPDRQDQETACISSVSSSATLVPSAQDPRGWLFLQSPKPPPSPSEQPPADVPPSSSALAPLVISTRYPSWGHASLSLFPSTSPSPESSSYISFWPSELGTTMPLPRSFHHIRKLHCKAVWSPSLAHDILEEEGRKPDLELHIGGMDVDRVQRWAEAEEGKARAYTPWNWNCAEVVWKAMYVGLGAGEKPVQDLGEGEGRIGVPRQDGFRSKIKGWEREPFVRDLGNRRPDKVAEGFAGRVAEVTRTKVPADLEVIVETMRVDGYGC